MSRRPVVFCNRVGERLVGIVEVPECPDPRVLPVILLSPGTKYRVAPHRLYVKLSRHLAARGHVVLRFDFGGLGDSEGDVSEDNIADFHGTVQLGRYVSDTRCAMDWLQDEHGARRFILAGLCGGALTGLLTGAQDRRVDAIVSLGMPVLLDSSAVDHTRFLTSGEIAQWGQGYFSKLADPRSWLRLLTFKSNYRVIAKVLSARVLQRSSPSTAPSAKEEDNFNPLFPPAFKAFAAHRPALLIFGGNDRLYSIYCERFAHPFAEEIRRCEGHVETHVVDGANHVFSLPAWEEEMRSKIDDWLASHYPALRPERALEEA
jgi:alpha-beta hydrolase superfamily lysophospholipase